MFPYIMAPARRDGAAGVTGPLGAPTSRCSTSESSGLAIANVLGGQWGLLFS